MRVTCPECDQAFDDAEKSTFCPHEALPPAGPVIVAGPAGDVRVPPVGVPAGLDSQGFVVAMAAPRRRLLTWIRPGEESPLNFDPHWQPGDQAAGFLLGDFSTVHFIIREDGDAAEGSGLLRLFGSFLSEKADGAAVGTELEEACAVAEDHARRWFREIAPAFVAIAAGGEESDLFWRLVAKLAERDHELQAAREVARGYAADVSFLEEHAAGGENVRSLRERLAEAGEVEMPVVDWEKFDDEFGRPADPEPDAGGDSPEVGRFDEWQARDRKGGGDGE